MTLEPEGNCYWWKKISYLFGDLRKIPVKEIDFPLKHPPFLIRDEAADSYVQKNIFQRNRIVTVTEKLRNKLKLWS